MGEVISLTDDNKIFLTKPYEFEGETFTEVDMQGICDLRGKDLVRIDKIFVSRGNNPAMTGLTLEYAELVANEVTGKPVEFFENLPSRDAIKLKNFVTHFFYGED